MDKKINRTNRELGLTLFTVAMRRLGVTVNKIAITAPNGVSAIDAAMARLGFDPATPLAGVSWEARS